MRHAGRGQLGPSCCSVAWVLLLVALNWLDGSLQLAAAGRKRECKDLKRTMMACHVFACAWCGTAFACDDVTHHAVLYWVQ